MPGDPLLVKTAGRRHLSSPGPLQTTCIGFRTAQKYSARAKFCVIENVGMCDSNHIHERRFRCVKARARVCARAAIVAPVSLYNVQSQSSGAEGARAQDRAGGPTDPRPHADVHAGLPASSDVQL